MPYPRSLRFVVPLRAVAAEHARRAQVASDDLTRRRHQARALYAWQRARLHAGRPVYLAAAIWNYLASPEL